MGEDRRDLVAAGALDVHEVRVGVLHEALQLVLALLVLGPGVEQIACELKKEQKSGSERHLKEIFWVFYRHGGS